MQGMRDVIRGSLARSLRRWAEQDRIAAALPAVCGSALAAHCRVLALDEDGQLQLEVDEEGWMAPLVGMRGVLQHDLQRVAGVPLSGLHFRLAGPATRRAGERGAGQERTATVPGSRAAGPKGNGVE